MGTEQPQAVEGEGQGEGDLEEQGEVRIYEYTSKNIA